MIAKLVAGLDPILSPPSMHALYSSLPTHVGNNTQTWDPGMQVGPKKLAYKLHYPEDEHIYNILRP